MARFFATADTSAAWRGRCDSRSDDGRAGKSVPAGQPLREVLVGALALRAGFSIVDV